MFGALESFLSHCQRPRFHRAPHNTSEGGEKKNCRFDVAEKQESAGQVGVADGTVFERKALARSLQTFASEPDCTYIVSCNLKTDLENSIAFRVPLLE
jgi:hypothetical protein